MECNSYFPKALTLKKEAINSNNKIHKPVFITENRNNPVGLKYRKKEKPYLSQLNLHTFRSLHHGSL